MKQSIVLLVVCILGLSLCQQGCDGSQNTQPIYSNPPVLQTTTTNGKYYVVDEVDPQLNVVHVYGSPYNMGYAHGTLLKAQIQEIVPQFEQYIYEQIDSAIDFLPKWMQDLIAEYGAEAALEATYWLTEPYTPKYFYDEIRGMADGSGVEYGRLLRIHMLPELIQASCSMFGAWGPAVQNTNMTLLQLRALDWSTNGPLQQYPLVLVYHPDDGHPFSILSWAGFIGTITGYSSAPMALCEKVWYAYNGTDSRSGIPWHFLTRDILQFDTTVDDALNRIFNAARTCAIWLGLGDASTSEFRAVGYAHDYVLVYDDNNFPYYKEHPRMNGLVYIDKHVQPSHNPCFGSLLKQYYGNLTPEITIKYITAIEATGNMHIAVFDYAHSKMYVANASPYVNGNYIPAYQRPFVELDMAALFAQQL